MPAPQVRDDEPDPLITVLHRVRILVIAMLLALAVLFALAALLAAPSPVARAHEDDLVRDLVRRVTCIGRTRVTSNYDLGPLLRFTRQDATARRLLAMWSVPDDEFAKLRRARSIWVLCALLDHPRVLVKARAAEGLAKIGDPRTAPMLWLHGRGHRGPDPEGTPDQRLWTALESARRAIGMDQAPKGFDFLVRRWLTPKSAPQSMKVTKALQRRVDAGQAVTWDEIVKHIPPAAEPIAGSHNWRWYPVDDAWIVSCHFIHGLRTIRLEPRLPEATQAGVTPDVRLPPRPQPETADQIARLVRQLDNPTYKNLTPPDLPPCGANVRIPERAAVWDLLPHGGKLAHVLIPQLTRLDEKAQYAGRYLLGRVVSPGVRGATEILGDNRSKGGRVSKAWSAWLDLVGAGIPRGGLAIRLRGSKTLKNGDVELDYTIGWFGNWSTWLPFADGRLVVTVLAERADGRRLTILARERYDTRRSSLRFDPHQLLLGRFIVPAGTKVVRARVRMSLPPAPAELRGLWSGTIESNTIDVEK